MWSVKDEVPDPCPSKDEVFNIDGMQATTFTCHFSGSTNQAGTYESLAVVNPLPEWSHHGAYQHAIPSTQTFALNASLYLRIRPHHPQEVIYKIWVDPAVHSTNLLLNFFKGVQSGWINVK